jgi:preprotein translocase subunit SecB
MMNERIRELAEQATCFKEDLTEGLYDIEIFDKEKFAELIVQECIDIIAPYTVRMSRPGEEYLHPIQEIKQHFGVER